MKMLESFKSIVFACFLLSGSLLLAQAEAVESFEVSDEVVVKVNTSYTNVIFETWNKDKVEVTARVEGEGLSKKEAQEILENWNYDVLGNSRKVVVTSNPDDMWFGLHELEGLSGLSELGKLESLKELENFDFNFDFDLPEMNFNFDIPEIPELAEFPQWPFSDDQPNLKDGNEYKNYTIKSGKSITFNKKEYEKDKQSYVDNLNRKYNSNVSVRQVDRWLDEVSAWEKKIEADMEAWGEEFGESFGDQFGTDFEIKMEKWGEEFGEKFGKDMEKWGEKFGKDMEKWGEEFGEKFGEDMEKWGEEFGKEMEKFGEEFEKKYGQDMEKWAEEFAKKFEESGGNQTIIIKRDNDGNSKGVRANKTLIIKMPKGAKTEVNVRHGELKMADAYNIRATLNYSPFTANSIDGGNTLINAAYAPIKVANWKNGELLVRYIDDCSIGAVEKINLDSNSSNVSIERLIKEAFLSGSFGDIKVNDIGNEFRQLNLNLDNSDVFISLPRTAFKFDFNGKKTSILYPKGLNLDKKNESGYVLLNGYAGNKNADKYLTIKARYSNIKLQ